MVKIGQSQQQNSRLGRLLVNRGYISEDQLVIGLKRQRETGQRLGEALIQSGWLSEKELHRVLKHQSRYRNAVALAAMVSLPFQPLVSFASTTSSASESQTKSAEQYSRSAGLVPMSEAELEAVAGQGTDTFVERMGVVANMATAAQDSLETGDPVNAENSDAIKGLKLVASTFMPILGYLESDVTISGVHYSVDKPRFSVRDDGALKLALPERIDEIRMDRITVNGGQGPSMGNVSLHNIEFDPRSSMTIYNR